jgi:plastocyanin
MRILLLSVALVIAAAASSCGSGGTSAPTTPSPLGTGTSGAASGATISILANRGAQSFNPNPASASQGTTLSWQNNDSVIHRIVMNDGSLDTGDIPPGGSSRALALATDGGNYHCTIHPTMVGSIRSASGTPPPCSGQYCDSSQ